MEAQGPTSEPSQSEAVPSSQRRWLLAALVVLLSLLQPHTWPDRSSAMWMPATGIVFALGVWRGYPTLLLILPVALLAGARSGLLAENPRWQQFLGESLYEGFFQTATLFAALWMYRHPGRGEADLRNPRSAMSFLVFSGLVLAAFALLRALPVWLFASEPFSLMRETAARWLAETLGLVAVAPPLLILATPWMIRSGLTGSNGWWDGRVPDASESDLGESTLAARTALAGRLRRLTGGDWVEIGLLVVGTTLLCLVLTAALNPRDPGGWQLWGAPLLLVVWAGIRQGLQGAPLAAAAGTAAAVLLLDLLWPEMSGPLLLQGNLLAQCGAALLVAASVSWIRTSEERYRQVVSQIPVVLYSTHLLPSSDRQPPPAEILFVNPPCAAILGCRPEALLGDHENWMKRVHPEDREIVRAAIAQLSRQKQPVVCEYRLAPKFGDPGAPASLYRSPLPEPHSRWVRDVMVPHFDSEGRLEGWEGMASDITEQRFLADDLRRTTSMFHTLVANLPAGVFFVSARSGRPILVNQRARQLLGQREDVAAGIEHLSEVYRLHRSDGSLYPVEELPVCEVLRSGAVSMRDDIIVHRPDGRRVPLISWAAPVDVGQSGRADAVVWVLEDLTELRQAEAARRETEGRLRTVIESLAEGLLVQDRHEGVIDCNSAAGALLGPLLQESGSVAEDGWVREDGSPLPPEEHPVRRVLRTGVPVRNVILGLPRVERCEQVEENGSGSRPRPSAPRLRWLLINALPLAPKPGSTPAGVVTTLLDVSDHIQAQQHVRDSEERYRGLIDSLPLMVLQFNQQLTLTLANPAMTAISGFALGEVDAVEDWSKLVHPEDLPGLMDAFQQALGGKNVRCECRYRAKDGQERFCYTFHQPVWSPEEPSPARVLGQPGREVIGITSLVLDLTRERRLEQELQRAQRLELVGRLSSSIAHDFNNLLAAMLGLTELAEIKAAEGEPVSEELKQINQVGEQATQLTQQILAFCKQRPIPLRRVDVNRATRRIADILHTLLPREVHLECDLDEAPLYVQADEIQLQQVVMNLCLNARDAMPHGGLLAVHTHIEPTEPTEGRPGPWLCLTVQDTGEGMTPELQSRIFEPFFSTKERGTGLGLAMVQQIIAGFGGQVKVESEPGRGSRFDVWLPLANVEA